MKIFFIIFLIIFSSLIISQNVYGQNTDLVSNQKSIEVKINETGEVHVTHVIKPLKVTSQIDLIEGNKSNLTVKDEGGNDVNYESVGENDSVIIFASRESVIVEYDLSDQLQMIDNLWTWDFLYRESTIFLFPEQVDLVFVNDRPAFLGEAEGITCHGCQMLLEYSLDEPSEIEKIKIRDMEFLIETRTWGQKTPVNFDKSKGLNFEILEKNRFVSMKIPASLLSEPYQVFLNGEKLFFTEFFSNSTHVWLNMRPQTSGEISITGTIPDEITDVLTTPSDEFSYEYLIVILVLIVIAIVVAIFFKRKK